MDIWKFYDITHRRHGVCNPISEEKLDHLVGILRLAPSASLISSPTLSSFSVSI